MRPTAEAREGGCAEVGCGMSRRLATTGDRACAAQGSDSDDAILCIFVQQKPYQFHTLSINISTFQQFNMLSPPRTPPPERGQHNMV